jgi:hypothetical protein
MWIIREPKKVALWNKRHFEEKNGECAACLKYWVLIQVCVEKIYKMNIWRVAVRSSYIEDARFFKVNVVVTHLSLILRVFDSVPGGTGYSGECVVDLPPDSMVMTASFCTSPLTLFTSITKSSCFSWCYTKSACEKQVHYKRLTTENSRLTVMSKKLATAFLRFLTLSCVLFIQTIGHVSLPFLFVYRVT